MNTFFKFYAIVFFLSLNTQVSGQNIKTTDIKGTIININPSSLGLGNVDNTSDINKPISNAVQTALNNKQNSLSGNGFVKVSGTSVIYDNSNYLSSISSSNVIAALGYTPYNSSNPNGYLNSVSWSQVNSKPSFSTVATSGDYNDLSNRPTIPTNTNQLVNGSGFITGSYLPLSGGTVSGDIYANGFFMNSDKRLKNIVSQNGDMIVFTWKDNRDDRIHYGYIAQEIEKKMPQQVTISNEYLSVNYIEVLVAKVNALEIEVQNLKKKLKIK